MESDFRLTGCCLGMAVVLTACGGGGTTGPLIKPDPLGWINPNRVTVTTDVNGATAQNVKVGVVDTGFLVNHFEIKDKIVASQEFAATGIIDDNVSPHGTQTAQVIGGRSVGYSGNATLLLAKVADSAGNLYSNTLSVGAQWTMDQGAKVVNISAYPAFLRDNYYKLMYDTAVAKDAVMVMSAGNYNNNLSTYTDTDAAGVGDIFDTGFDSYKNLSLIVGALDGNAKASYSAFAGENAAVQSRFLVADGLTYVQSRTATAPAADTNGLVTYSGTSASAPIVAAAAATVRAYWPHMNAQQTSQLLLDTADRTFSPLYSLNNCGASTAVNCGFYTFGQGKLSLAKAMQPVGIQSIPSGYTVGGPSVPVQGTSLVLPSAFGDAAQGLTLKAALFDSYGRDFSFNAMSMMNASQQRSFMQSMLGLQSNGFAPGGEGMAYGEAGFDVYGKLSKASFSQDMGRYSVSFAYGKGAGLDQHDSPMHMVSLAGSGNLGRYDHANAIGVSMGLDGGSRIEGRFTHADSAGQGSTNGPSASRQEFGYAFKSGADTTISLGYAVTLENHAMLGSTGSGALGLKGSQTQAAVFKMRHALGNGWAAFGQAEFGSMNVSGSGMLVGIDGAVTSQFAAGLAWAGLDSRFGVVLSQPVRIESASARFNVPVGRTIEGAVIRNSQNLSMAPSGRQVNFEMAWNRQVTPLSSLGLNAVYARDFGHVAGAKELAFMASYRRAW